MKDGRMANKRVYQVARDLGKDADKLMKDLKSLGFEIKSTLSSVTPDAMAKLDKLWSSEKADKEAPKAKAKPKAKPRAKAKPKASAQPAQPTVNAITKRKEQDKAKAVISRPAAVIRKPVVEPAVVVEEAPAPVEAAEEQTVSVAVETAVEEASPVSDATEVETAEELAVTEAISEPEAEVVEKQAPAKAPVRAPKKAAAEADPSTFDPAQGPVILVKKFVAPGQEEAERRARERKESQSQKDIEQLQRNLKPVTAELPRGRRKPDPNRPARPAQPRGRTFPIQPRGGRKGGPRLSKRERRLEKMRARETRQEELQKQIQEAEQKVQQEGQDIFIPEGISVGGLAEKLNLQVKDIITKLLARGLMATINQPLDEEIAVSLAAEFGFRAEIIPFEDNLHIDQETDADEDLQPRAPVVTVVGHVDHGKSSLLEAIHDIQITRREKGGITQHLGAYLVENKAGKKTVFIDTPGHEAFTEMRARGAQVTDIIVLVVAADDGVMPQTIEAIDHAKAAKVPIIVAINKVDKPEANPDKVMQELSQHGIQVEKWGGDFGSVEVSALKGTGIDNLLDRITLEAEMLNVSANPDKPATGTILEARLDRSKGPVATVLVQAGTLKTSNIFLAGSVMGRVRAMLDESGAAMEAVGPSTPVEVLGFSSVPLAGEVFQVVADETQARQISGYRQEREKEKELAKSGSVTLTNLFDKIQEGEIKDLPVVLKADVQGSVEVVKQIIEGMSTDQVRTSVILSNVGAISETDVLLAAASNAIIIGFNVRPDKKAQEAAKQHSVEIRLYGVIYHIEEELKQAMEGLLSPVEREAYQGKAEVREQFKIPKVGIIAGCMITDGKATRKSRLRVIRDGVVIHEGAMASLKRFKEDSSEVTSGFECGVGINAFNDVKPGDTLEFYIIEQVKATLD